MDCTTYRTVDWDESGVGPAVVMIDQRILPGVVEMRRFTDYREVAEAIRNMTVRGAPAIGAAAALGMALGARQIGAANSAAFMGEFELIAAEFRATRPTAVNLFWAIERMLGCAEQGKAGRGIDSGEQLAELLRDEALSILDEDIAANKALGAYGAELIPDPCRILTHCNAGALATVGYGTALGVVRAAAEQGKRIAVYADETRPRLQGMKLTAYELKRDGIDVTVICDNTAGPLMRAGKVDCVIVGADRIAANGDTANKIGTYTLAVMANRHGVPFYVAAPLSTVDFNLATGDGIPIEERSDDEVLVIDGVRIGPDGVRALNYAFDVTPADLITAIITERGVVRPPFGQGLAGVHQDPPRPRGRQAGK